MDKTDREGFYALLAAFAPAPTEDDIKVEQQRDKAKNPYNEDRKPPIRSRNEIIAALRCDFAEALLLEVTRRIEDKDGCDESA